MVPRVDDAMVVLEWEDAVGNMFVVGALGHCRWIGSEPIRHSQKMTVAYEGVGGEEGTKATIVAGGDAPPVFQAAEHYSMRLRRR